MDKINSIVNIIRSSISFDNSLENGGYCELQQQNNLLKSHLQNLMILNPIDDTEKKLLKLSEHLYKINENIIDLVNGSQKHTKIDLTKNTLLFFYKEHCEPSLNFVSEWTKLKKMVNGKVNMVSINCSKSKYDNVCDSLGVYEYPTVKYLYNNKVDTYIGNMNANEIFATYLR
jgi:hypothetical protein